MKKEEMMLKATQMLAKGKFKLKKASPTIMIVGAAIGGVTAAVLACKATLKAEEIIAEHNAQVETIHTTKAQVDSGEMQLKDGEDQYRTLMGKTDIRVDDPNRELKLEKERLQLQKDVKQLRHDVYVGESFIKDVMKDAGKKALTDATAKALGVGGHTLVEKGFHNPDLANIMFPLKDNGQKKDDKKDS